ncbi:MAG TPA: glycosyltransferase family 4 protein [Pirellulales bacterium]|nr:glycosyltransferase family 4 protein [Pirellulales bacterium]
MKVLVLSNLYPPDFIGGYELCCRQMVDGLLGRGHQVRVLTTVPRTPCPAVEHVARELELVNCYDPFDVLHNRPVTRKVTAAKAALVSAHNVHVLLDNLRRFQPDVVYLWNLFGLGGLGLVGCLEYIGAPWVWYLGDCVPRMLCSIGEDLLPGLASQFGRYVRGSFMPVSERVIHEIEAAGVELQGDINTSPNWVLGRQPEPRKRYFRPGERLRIVSSGQMGRHKGIHLLVEAAAVLRARGFENFHIDLYGKVTDPSVEPLPRQHGVTDLVTFRGMCPQEELVDRYARHEYDVFAFPTWKREPFGCAPLEAAAYGTVMVVSESCGIGEWFVDGVHCLKTARTGEAFADVLAGILEGKIDLKPVGRRASAVIWRDFHLDVLLPEIETALARAQGQSRSPAGTAEEAYRLALLAEKLTRALVQENASFAEAA